MIVEDIAKFRNNSRNGIINQSLVLVITLDWVKSSRADICGNCRKGCDLRVREVEGFMRDDTDTDNEVYSELIENLIILKK